MIIFNKICEQLNKNIEILIITVKFRKVQKQPFLVSSKIKPRKKFLNKESPRFLLMINS